jgi:hypothetical protein
MATDINMLILFYNTEYIEKHFNFIDFVFGCNVSDLGWRILVNFVIYKKGVMLFFFLSYCRDIRPVKQVAAMTYLIPQIW